MLKNINIPNYRIDAIDGKLFDKNKLKDINYVRKMNIYEISTTLSHIKAISYLNLLKGDYFMICEDDIEFKNLNLMDNLNNIIKNAPIFDILMIHKIYHVKLENTYTDWNKHLKEKEQIAGAGCYIISRNGINNILKLTYNVDNDNKDLFNFKKDINFDVADMFIFENLKTYIYKFNFSSIKCLESTIHEEDNKIHEEWHKKCEIIQDKYIIESIIK